MTPESREELEEALACLYEVERSMGKSGYTYRALESTRNARKRLERVLHPQEVEE